MTQIGNAPLLFSVNCVLLADKIYPNGHPIFTPYSTVQLRLKQGNERRNCTWFNRYYKLYRVSVEHAIGQMKVYKSVSSVWRYPIRLLSIVVRVCASMVCHRTPIALCNYVIKLNIYYLRLYENFKSYFIKHKYHKTKF